MHGQVSVSWIKEATTQFVRSAAAKIFKRRNNMYTDLAKLDNRQSKRSLSALHNAPAPGKKIQKNNYYLLN